MSPSSRYTTERVCASTADASDATKFSPLPMATSNGEPRRAATIVSGSRLEITALPYVPSTELPFQHGDLSGRAKDLEFTVPADHGEAGRVIAAILEALETLENDGRR